MATLDVSSDVSGYLAEAQALSERLRGSTPSWLADMRARGAETLSETGFPTPRDEEWKYTNPAPITRSAFRLADGDSPASVTAQEVERIGFGSPDWVRVVFVDGHYAAGLSSGECRGARVITLAQALDERLAIVEERLGQQVRPTFHGFAALNTALIRDGAVVYIPEGTAMERPIHLIFVSATGDHSAAYPRNLIVAGPGSQAVVVESYVSLASSPYLTDAVTEIVVGEGAMLDYYKLQNEGLQGYHVGVTHVRQETRSTFTATTVNVGADLARNDLNVILDGEGCECTLNGLTLVGGERHVDNHTAIDHAKPNCTSHELYKAVLDGRSRSVFNGKIYVWPNAQKTDAKQTNRNLLLSKQATVDTKPQLEIFADDVKCTHGATVGQLEDVEIFYLRSRGMSEDTARKLLTFGFANDIIKRIKLEAIRTRLTDVVSATYHAPSGLEDAL